LVFIVAKSQVIKMYGKLTIKRVSSQLII